MSRPTPTYEECYALVLLREYLHMTNLKLSDRPDIVYDNKSGIEVVSALFEEDKRLETILMRKKENKKTDHLPPGYTQCPYFIMHPLKSSQDCGATNKYERCTSEAIELIKRTIDKKKEKVDSYNKANNFKTDRLFVFTRLFIDGDALKVVGRDMYHRASDTFTNLYLLVEDVNCLIVCNSHGIFLNFFTDEEQYQYACQAQNIQRRIEE